MRTKLVFLTGVGVGYVLGSRAGRTRYEQIKTKSQELWQSEPVQTKVSDAGDAIKAAAPVVTEKVSDAAKQATEAAKTKLSSDDAPAETNSRGPADTTPRATSTS